MLLICNKKLFNLYKLQRIYVSQVQVMFGKDGKFLFRTCWILGYVTTFRSSVRIRRASEGAYEGPSY